MQDVWMFSEFTVDSTNTPLPVCSAYTSNWHAITFAAPGASALVYCTCDDVQLEAATLDPEVVVIPRYRDPLPLTVTQAYAAQGATENMTLAQLLVLLSKIDPLYIRTDPNMSTLIALGLS